MPTKWKSGDHFVSFYDFLPEVVKGARPPSRVSIHDVTLRDGEQQAGLVFRREEKVKIARMLDGAGVDRIEAGLPSVSPEDAKAIYEIVHLGLNAKIYAFARCMKQDVDNALNLDVDGLVMEIPSSDHLIKIGYGWSIQKAIGLAVEATRYAHDHGLKVTFFTIDATRAPFNVFWKLVGTVADEGHMDALALADTFGVMKPEAISYLVKRVKKMTKKPVEMHAHNDYGLAVANTIAGVLAGADTIHVTVNGIGERCGNASLEEAVLALAHLYGVKTNLKFEKLRSLSEVVSSASGVPLPPQKPVVGDGIFTVESGIIAGWWRNIEKVEMPLEMYPFPPSTVGHAPVRIVLGKKSGRDSVLYMAEKAGVHLEEDEIDSILAEAKNLAIEKKRALSLDETNALIDTSRKHN
jgi:isopropylmalate/homocitrate/citramalate synthase